MAAVAAASAELLIIGWYIFRVLLQTLPSVPAPSREQRLRGAAVAPLRTIAKAFSTYVVFLECCIYWVGFAFRNPPGTQPIARSEVFRYSLQKLAYTVSRTGRQVLGERRPARPQLRAQLPALGGRVIRCSCASRPAWEPAPRRNGGSPVLPRQRSTCQGQ